MKRKAQRAKPVKTRNLLHDHPLLRKGGVHRKPYKATRAAERQILRRDRHGEWSDQNAGTGHCGQATLLQGAAAAA